MKKEYPYHMRVKVMSRSKGHNALAAAAYRSGSKVTENTDENEIDWQDNALASGFVCESIQWLVQDFPARRPSKRTERDLEAPPLWVAFLVFPLFMIPPLRELHNWSWFYRSVDKRGTKCLLRPLRL